MERAISYSLFRQIELSTNQNAGRGGSRYPNYSTSLPLPFQEKEHGEKESGTRGAGVLAKRQRLPLRLLLFPLRSWSIHTVSMLNTDHGDLSRRDLLGGTPALTTGEDCN